MARQGSLRQYTALLRCILIAMISRCALFFVIAAGTLASGSPAIAEVATSSIDLRVIFAFDAPAPQPWHLRLRLADETDPEARLSELRNYSDADTTAGMFDLSVDGQSLTLRPRHEIVGGKFEMRIRCSRDAKLWVERLENDSGESDHSKVEAIAVTELVKGKPVGNVEDAATEAKANSRWTLSRVPTDRLRVEKLSPVPVYQPGAPLNLSMRTNALLEQASRSCVLTYELYRISDGTVVQDHRWPLQINPAGDSQTVQLSDKLPEQAGVYELRFEVDADDENIWSRLRRRSPPVVRVTYPIAILHRDKDTASDAQTWREVGVIRPSESSWSVGQWLPKSPSRLIPGSVVTPPSFETLPSETYERKSVSLLSPLETFQATLPVDKPGYPHRVTLRIPSTTTGELRIEVGTEPKRIATSFVIDSDATADHQGPWREHTFVHYPVEGDQIWLTNLDPTTRVAFESISVQAGPLRLASPSEPRFSSRVAAMRLANIRWPEIFSEDLAERTPLDGCATSTVELNRLWVAAERVQDEARVKGCNGLVIPANSGSLAWYESSRFSARFDPDAPTNHYLETLLQLLGSSELQIMVELNPNMLLTSLEQTIVSHEANLFEITRGESTAVPAVFDPFTPDSALSRIQYNPLHPLVQSEVAELARELCDRCRRYPGFAGLLVDGDRSSHLRPLLASEEDPGALLLFGRANGITGGVAQIRNWMQQQPTDRFPDWVDQRMQAAYERVSGVDGTVAVRTLAPGTVKLKEMTADAAGPPKASPTPAAQGRRPPAPWVSQFRYGPPAVLAQKSRFHYQIATATAGSEAVLLSEQRMSGAPSRVRQLMQHDLSQIIDQTDPRLLMLDESLLGDQLSDSLRSTLQSFCAMPDCSMEPSNPIDSASHTVHLRSAVFDDHVYVSMVGMVPWNCDVDLEMATPTHWEVLARRGAEQRNGNDNPGDNSPSPLSGSPVRSSGSLVQSSGGTRARITIPAGQIVLLRSKEPGVNAIRSWTTRVSGGPELVEAIKQKVTLIVERVGALSNYRPYASLNNGGFEQSGGMGLVGWLHAQHPPGCVQVDESEFVEGSQSVLLTTSTPAVARTWLVSETLDPPASGRLAVSLACRAEAKEDDSGHHLRISIEATRRGDPVRFTRDLHVPRNGQWSEREVVLEIDEIETSAIESLRLTIDSLSGGRVWIDDVQLHDQFPTSKERADLQSQVFLAVQGLQRGNLLPSGKLLQNHWARHLLTLGPAEQPKRVIETVPAPSEAPGVAERFRSWLPRPLRF